MQQHPVPQNVTSYQFRLIGDMTLKQFLQLLAGGIVAFVFYSTNLISPVKWFFMFISVVSGAAFAFLPLEGRPLDQWLMAFIRAIYMPTHFYWQKKPKLPEYLDHTPSSRPPTDSLAPIPQSSPNQNKSTEADQIDEHRSKRIDEIINLYQQTPIPTPPSPPSPQIVTPAPRSAEPTPNQSLTTVEVIQITPNQEEVGPAIQPPSASQSNNPQPRFDQHTITAPPPTPITTTSSAAIFNPDLPFPSLPEVSNILVGMVFDHSGNSLEGVLLEIKNESGTVRATKTNRLGQFFLASPLKDGSYVLECEKAGHTFKPTDLKIEGKIYPPLEIRAEN